MFSKKLLLEHIEEKIQHHKAFQVVKGGIVVDKDFFERMAYALETKGAMDELISLKVLIEQMEFDE